MKYEDTFFHIIDWNLNFYRTQNLHQSRVIISSLILQPATSSTAQLCRSLSVAMGSICSTAVSYWCSVVSEALNAALFSCGLGQTEWQTAGSQHRLMSHAIYGGIKSIRSWTNKYVASYEQYDIRQRRFPGVSCAGGQIFVNNGRQFITMSVHLCVQRDGRDEPRVVAPSVCSRWKLKQWADKKMLVTFTEVDDSRCASRVISGACVCVCPRSRWKTTRATKT